MREEVTETLAIRLLLALILHAMIWLLAKVGLAPVAAPYRLAINFGLIAPVIDERFREHPPATEQTLAPTH